jgi:hypothetical protein
MELSDTDRVQSSEGGIEGKEGIIHVSESPGFRERRWRPTECDIADSPRLVDRQIDRCEWTISGIFCRRRTMQKLRVGNHRTCECDTTVPNSNFANLSKKPSTQTSYREMHAVTTHDLDRAPY